MSELQSEVLEQTSPGAYALGDEAESIPEELVNDGSPLGGFRSAVSAWEGHVGRCRRCRDGPDACDSGRFLAHEVYEAQVLLLTSRTGPEGIPSPITGPRPHPVVPGIPL
ncbi:MAG: hypothetical protein L3K09_02255 [Thermoplasmata archaeon]|nr:hypothetical protein [Thermoplasmata archaeon]